MAAPYLTRRQVARRVGISYANLRLYESALAGCLDLRIGKNRTVLYDEGSVAVVERAVDLKQVEGWTLPQVARFLEARGRPAQGRGGVPPGGDLASLAEDVRCIRAQNLALFQLGVRLFSRLDRLQQQYRDVFGEQRVAPTPPPARPRAVNE